MPASKEKKVAAEKAPVETRTVWFEASEMPPLIYRTSTPPPGADRVAARVYDQTTQTKLPVTINGTPINQATCLTLHRSKSGTPYFVRRSCAYVPVSEPFNYESADSRNRVIVATFYNDRDGGLVCKMWDDTLLAIIED